MPKLLSVHPVGKELEQGNAASISRALRASLSADAFWIRSWYAREEGKLYCEWDAKDAESIRRVMVETVPDLPIEAIHRIELVDRRGLREEGARKTPEEGVGFRLTYPEVIFAVGIIGCMLFATWELAHLLADNWLGFWIVQNPTIIRRVVLYGFALLMSIVSLLITTRLGTRFGRFGETVKRAFLWYGVILLIAAAGIFVFDCLPEVFAYIIGAALFIASIYIFQKRYLKEREAH